MSEKTRRAAPKATAMIEALRGLGYSTATALADIVDNSIAACANQVDILFSWDGFKSTICVLDNGVGMNDQELELAMRLGEKSPLEIRTTDDLGRFGLGLKTASFSQCRKLTVASCKDSVISCLRWDLDILAASKDDGWYLLEGPSIGSEKLLLPLEKYAAGTIVVWENLDRVVTPSFYEQDFLDVVDKVEHHLAMVFHRFIVGPKTRLTLTINGRSVEPWDPFLTNNTATWSSPVARIQSEGGEVRVQCFVLPHKDRLSENELEFAAGPDGWTAQQGFYVYRNERLLVAGSWLGLGRGRSWTKEEPHRLARIRLDLPNTADAIWKIDVRKSTARPPASIRERLTRIAEDTRDRARRVFAHRGQLQRAGHGATLEEVWRVEHFKGVIRYRIDKNHPAVKVLLEDVAGTTNELQLLTMLRVIEETIPVQRIWLDTAEAHETPRTGFADEPTAEVNAILMVMYKNMITLKGVSPLLAKAQLLRTEPFNNYPELVKSLPDSISQQESKD